MFAFLVSFFTNLTTGFAFVDAKPSYVAQLCRELDLGDNEFYCMEWFRQATDHCFETLFRREKKSSLWSFVHKMLFEEHSYGLLDPRSMNRFPAHLSRDECEKLLVEINKDYLLNIEPQYKNLVSQSCHLVSIIWWLLLIILVIPAFQRFFGHMHTLSKTWRWKFGYRYLNSAAEKKFRHLSPILNARSLQAMKYETAHLKVLHQVQPEHLFLQSGAPMLLLKASSKYSLLQSLVQGHLETMGRFYNLREISTETPKKSIYTTNTTVQKVLQYANKFKQRPLHLMIIFDNDIELIRENSGSSLQINEMSSHAQQLPRFKPNSYNAPLKSESLTRLKSPMLTKVLPKIEPKIFQSGSMLEGSQKPQVSAYTSIRPSQRLNLDTARRNSAIPCKKKSNSKKV